MKLSIDPAASAPPFEQLRRQVIDAVADGSLAPGARMPTVRALAAELGLAVNTVAKAYRALEDDHVIERRGRAGTFVVATGDPVTREAQLAAHRVRRPRAPPRRRPRRRRSPWSESALDAAR